MAEWQTDVPTGKAFLPDAETCASQILEALATRLGASSYFVHIWLDGQWQVCINQTGDIPITEHLRALSAPQAEETTLTVEETTDQGIPLTIATVTDGMGRRMRTGLVWRGETPVVRDLLENELLPLAALIHASVRAASVKLDHKTLESALDAVPHLVWVMGRDRRYLFQNRADRASFQDMRGKRLADTDLPPEIIAEWGELHARAFNGESICLLDHKTVGDDAIFAENLISPIKSADGEIAAIVGLSIDRTAQHRAELAGQSAMEALQKNQTLLEEIAELSGVGGWELDLSSLDMQWTQETRRIHEVADDYQPSFGTAVSFFAPESLIRLNRHMDDAVAAGLPWADDFILKTETGKEITVRVAGRAVTVDGQAVRLQGAIQDVTELRQSQARLEQALETADQARSLLEDIVEAVPDGIVAFDADERLILHNQAFLEFFEGADGSRLTGKSFEDLLRLGLSGNAYADVGRTSRSMENWKKNRLERFRNPGEAWLMQLSDGRWLQMRDRKSVNGQTVGIRTDVTEIKRQEERLRYIAEHDILTGLANREALHERLDMLTGQLEQTGGQSSAMLVIIDLDNFKDINDTLGHDVGDEALRVIASRLVDLITDADVICRLGGDEFGIIISGIGSENDASARLDHLSDALTAPIATASHEIHPTYSIGACLFPRDGETSTQLFKNADIALYEAKRLGRDRWHLFQPELRAMLEQRQFIVDRLANPRDDDVLKIALQPKFNAQTGEHHGFETLLRWQVDGRLISPAQFIPVAEENGKIMELGRFALERTLALRHEAMEAGLDFGPAAVNVAAAQLRDPDFAEEVAELLQRYEMDATSLEFEITETVLLDRHLDLVTGTLLDLKSIGVDIALDDFGTGYASLSHLYQFPIDVLKIDREFVGKMLIDRGAASIVQAIIGLGQDLGLKVVAEGVEHDRQIEMLQSMGCDLLQGFGLGVPMYPDRVMAFLSDSQPIRKKA